MNAELAHLAFKIADITARSYIESFCLHDRDLHWYRTTGLGGLDASDVRDALRYLKLRGGCLPYKVERKRGLVRFVDTEPAK